MGIRWLHASVALTSAYGIFKKKKTKKKNTKLNIPLVLYLCSFISYGAAQIIFIFSMILRSKLHVLTQDWYNAEHGLDTRWILMWHAFLSDLITIPCWFDTDYTGYLMSSFWFVIDLMLIPHWFDTDSILICYCFYTDLNLNSILTWHWLNRLNTELILIPSSFDKNVIVIQYWNQFSN